MSTERETEAELEDLELDENNTDAVVGGLNPQPVPPNHGDIPYIPR